MVVVKDHQQREPSMGDITTIGLDLAKNVFQVHAVDVAGSVVPRKKFSDDPQHAFPSIRAGARREAESCPRRSSSPILRNMIFGTHKTSSGGWSG
jgi:transposase